MIPEARVCSIPAPDHPALPHQPDISRERRGPWVRSSGPVKDWWNDRENDQLSKRDAWGVRCGGARPNVQFLTSTHPAEARAKSSWRG
jgi:hypothetical protein